jgi:hypothetical protein
MQGGYERAHLTRYTALYTSLSSSYSLSFEDSSAVAAPFPAGKQDESMLSITNYTDVAVRRDKGVSLSGVQVSSNSTGMVHSEQMLPLGTSPKTVETLKLVAGEAGDFSVSNTTDLVLRDVGVFRRVDRPDDATGARQPRIEAAYVPRLDAAWSEPLRFAALKQPEEKGHPTVWLESWKTAPIFALPGSEGEQAGMLGNKARIRLTRLARLAADQLRLLPGDVRLIGWTDQPLSGMRIRPEAPQNATFTLVVAHLVRGQLPAPRADRNVAEDYLDPTALDADLEGVEAAP